VDRRLGLGALVGLILCGGGIPTASLARTASASPASVARSYFAAYNRRDGKAMCAAFTAELRTWFEHLPVTRHAACPERAAGRIGYGEESDTPIFRRLDVRSARAFVAGDTARVEMRSRYHYKHYPKPRVVTLTDEIYLVQRDGRWQVAKPGGIWFATQSAYSVPESALDPPVSDDEAGKPAPQTPARFDCASRRLQTILDPPGDAAASLDVREVTAGVNPDGSICFRFSFAQPPHPGTGIALTIRQPLGDTTPPMRERVTEASVRLGTRGRFFFSVERASRSFASRHLSAGWEDGRLVILWRPSEGTPQGAQSLRFNGQTKTFQAWEPFIRAPLLGRGSDPWRGWQDSFGS
jgi:hypothetical protein